MTETPLQDVRSLFQSERNAVLCSAHADLDGWPFGSVVPYAISSNGSLIVFLSDISEHSKNLQADNRATVFVADPSVRDNPQAGPRHAMLVRARRPAGTEEAEAESHYFARFPDAEQMRSAHGFAVWLLDCHRIRWIAGFGGMGWIEGDQWQAATD
jgi:heme iron utilization protein